MGRIYFAETGFLLPDKRNPVSFRSIGNLFRIFFVSKIEKKCVILSLLWFFIKTGYENKDFSQKIKVKTDENGNEYQRKV